MRRLFFAILLALPMAGQAPPATAPAKPARVVPPARIVDFTAKPAAVQAGQPVVLSWRTENPNAVNLEPSVGKVTARGTRQVTPAATTTYTLTVDGPENAK